MKKIGASLLLLLLTTVTFAQQQKHVKELADKMAKATISSDFNTVIDYTYPPIITMAGGKQKMLAMVKQMFAQMKASNMKILDASVGEAGKITPLGKRQFCVLPQRLIMEASGKKMSTNSSLLAVTEDKGAHWYFINSGTVPEQSLYQFFPEIKGKITIPRQTQPVMLK